MKKNLILSMLLGLLMLNFIHSCKTDASDYKPHDPEWNDPNWLKLVLTGKQRGVTAIYGSYEDTLIVATSNELYMTTDSGRSWKQVYGGSIGISGLSSFKGELIAFNSFGNTARQPFLFSQDNGLTWSFEGKRESKEYVDLEVSLREVAIAENISYLIKYNYDGVHVEKDPITQLPLPDELFRIQGDERTSVHLPEKRRINCMVLDEKGRLNVGTEGIRFEYSIKGNTKIYPTQTDTAIVYISRKPVN